jgi:hypothetical protein
MKLFIDDSQCTNASPKGETALSFTIREGHLEVVKVLLAKGAKINRRRKVVITSPSSYFCHSSVSNTNIMTVTVTRMTHDNACS